VIAETGWTPKVVSEETDLDDVRDLDAWRQRQARAASKAQSGDGPNSTPETMEELQAFADAFHANTKRPTP
jgi:hypothetical protein